jgi:hypothetical protein
VPYRSERLQVPHAEVAARRFVLIPLLELELGLTLPDGTRLGDRLAALPLTEGVRRAGPPLADSPGGSSARTDPAEPSSSG